jgi:hypothetical protein
MKIWSRVGEKCTFFPIFKQLGDGYVYCIKMGLQQVINHISELFQLAKWFKNDYFEKSKFNSLEIN